MIHSRGAQASDAEVVWTQIIQGFGGGFASVCSSVAAQASVPHVDMAMTTAMVLLWTEIGGAVGSAIGASPPLPSPRLVSCLVVHERG